MPATVDHAALENLSFDHLVGFARRPTMQGFVASYEEKGRGLVPPRFEGLLAPLVNWWDRRKAAANPISDRGREIMRCQPQGHVEALTTLALQFGVCSRWFSSVPGETWPNRNFMHAATSDGAVDNDVRFYEDQTIFQQLEDHNRSWRQQQPASRQQPDPQRCLRHLR